jgi:Cu/Zn superoxide dismutase
MTMSRYVGLMLAIAALVLGATAGVAQIPAPLRVQLTPQNSSGESGIATLTEEGSKTKVVVDITGAPAGVAQPLHIHKGTCASLDPQPAYGLATLTNGKSETTVDAPLTFLRTAPFAINGHKSAEDAKTYVFCGNIPTP